MTDQATLYICISAPICLVIVAFIFRKRKIHATGKLPDGSSISIGEPAETDVVRAQAQPRIPFTMSEMGAFAEMLAPMIQASVAHGCIQGDLIASIAEGHQATTETILDLLEDAKAQGRNGRITRGLEKMKNHDAEFRKMVSGRLVV